MSAPLTHPERVAIARLQALLELLPTALDKRLRPAGITAFEYTLLESLAEAERNTMRMSEVASKTNASLPRLSRVANSLERRGLAVRSACTEDARATNLVLTEAGAKALAHSQELYASAVRELVLDGVQGLADDGVSQLANISYAVLTSLDPRGDYAGEAPEEEPATCAADPAPACAADPRETSTESAA